MSETRRYRKFSPQQKLELVMASWRGERSIAELCREHDSPLEERVNLVAWSAQGALRRQPPRRLAGDRGDAVS